MALVTLSLIVGPASDPGTDGLTLLSQHRSAVASSAGSEDTGPENAFDGGPRTRWESAAGPAAQWIQVDLGGQRRVRRVLVSWQRAASAYQVQISADGTIWTTAYAGTDGDRADLTGLAVAGRYVRLFAERAAPGGRVGPYGVWEIQVYGTEAPPVVAGSPSATTRVAPTPKPAPSQPTVPFGSHRHHYVAGTLRPSGQQSTLDAQVVAYYRSWRAAFVRRDCGTYHVISPDAEFPIVAEAQGYGLVITALMAGADPEARTLFDGILRYVLAHPSRVNPALTAAEQNARCVSVHGIDSATDGDLDIAFGLLLADRQWGSRGRYNYRALALTRIRAIKSDEVSARTHLFTLGDWSTPGSWSHEASRTSDWIIDHVRAFRRASGDPAWDTIRVAHQRAISGLRAGYAPGTGLLPDFVVDTATRPAPARGRLLESDHDGDYFWNACRVPWRVGADAITSGDAGSLAAARAITRWVRAASGDDPGEIVAGYALDGEPLAERGSAAFVAPFAVAATTDPTGQAWLDALWRHMLAAPVTPTGYYAASLQLQAMIVVSGNYWVP